MNSFKFHNRFLSARLSWPLTAICYNFHHTRQLLLYLNIMLVAVPMSFPPYKFLTKLACAWTPYCWRQLLTYSSRFHSAGSNMSCFPSVHIGITISVHACKHTTSSQLSCFNWKNGDPCNKMLSLYERGFHVNNTWKIIIIAGGLRNTCTSSCSLCGIDCKKALFWGKIRPINLKVQ